MADRFFLDTNIFVYSVTADDARKARIATDLVRSAIAQQKGVVSYQVVQEFFNLAIRRFARPMELSDCSEYLNTVFRPMLRVHSSTRLFAEALTLQSRHKLSWYDALIVSSAIEAECTFLYSEDLQHGQRFRDLQIQNPFR